MSGHAIMIRFDPDGRAVLFMLHSDAPDELARCLQRLAANLVENPGAAPRLVGAVEEAVSAPRGRTPWAP